MASSGVIRQETETCGISRAIERGKKGNKKTIGEPMLLYFLNVIHIPKITNTWCLVGCACYGVQEAFCYPKRKQKRNVNMSTRRIGNGYGQRYETYEDKEERAGKTTEKSRNQRRRQ